LNRAFSNGFTLDAHYTWSKSIDNTDNMEDNQGFNSGGTTGTQDIVNRENNRKISFSDIPHRFVASFMYQLPFGAGRPFDLQNSVAKAILGGWETGGTVIAQQGMPFAITGANSGGVTARPDLVPGVPLEVPENLQRWYDGRTTITLPSGRQITPQRNTFLKYNPDAFRGRVLTTANGSVVPDIFWNGTAASTYDALRGPGRFNIDLSLRRVFRIRERMSLEFAADATNLLNNTQYSGNYTGSLGNTLTATNPSRGLEPGMGSNDAFGTLGVAAFDPRQVVMNLRLRF
jgi:hypothetical protein